jgi:hypothetical protein
MLYAGGTTARATSQLLRRSSLPAAAGASALWPAQQLHHHRAHTAAAAASPQPGGAPAPSPLDADFVLTLERAIGERSGADAELLRSGLFAAEVFPDLPVATTWDGLYRAMAK